MEQEDTELLLDTARRWFRSHRPLSSRVADFDKPAAAAPEAWTQIAEMGWTALSLPESAGGFDAGYGACFALLREAGADGRPEALGLQLLLAPLVARVLPAEAEALATGGMRLALADLGSVQWKDASLTGRAGTVLGADDATHLLLPVDDTLALVDLAATGIRSQAARLVDGRATAVLHFDATAARRLPGDGLARQALDRGAAALVADSAGLFSAAFALTLDYLKQRVQFGKPLSAQQAVQHKMAEVFCDLQQLLALAGRLAAELDGSAEGPWPTLAPAKAFLGHRALKALGQLIQVSGGIAVTEEYRLSHDYRRLQVAATLFGDAESQLARIDVRRQLLGAP